MGSVCSNAIPWRKATHSRHAWCDNKKLIQRHTHTNARPKAIVIRANSHAAMRLLWASFFLNRNSSKFYCFLSLLCQQHRLSHSYPYSVYSWPPRTTEIRRKKKNSNEWTTQRDDTLLMGDGENGFHQLDDARRDGSLALTLTSIKEHRLLAICLRVLWAKQHCELGLDCICIRDMSTYTITAPNGVRTIGFNCNLRCVVITYQRGG